MMAHRKALDEDVQDLKFQLAAPRSLASRAVSAMYLIVKSDLQVSSTNLKNQPLAPQDQAQVKFKSTPRTLKGGVSADAGV